MGVSGIMYTMIVAPRDFLAEKADKEVKETFLIEVGKIFNKNALNDSNLDETTKRYQLSVLGYVLAGLFTGFGTKVSS